VLKSGELLLHISFELKIYSHHQCNFATPGLKDFHERLQFFLLLYIEASSYIDSGDSIWQLLLVFERRQPLRASSSKASSPTLTWGPNSDSATLSAVKAATALKDTRFFIAGYTTLYKFFHFPSAYRLRLSQILILPPFQRRGHGKYLLLQVRLCSKYLLFIFSNSQHNPSFRYTPRLLKTHPTPR
jgi:histone acetyltransferase 1